MSSLPFGGFGKKKKQDEPPPAANSGTSAQPAAAVLVESNTQLTSFSQAAVDASQFNPPAGYKQVEPKQID